MTRRLLSLALFACTAPALAADPVALHCERMFDARTGRVLGEHTITVEDGRIRSVQPGLVPAAAGVRTIALARIMMPQSHVRLSAGRTGMSDEMQALCFFAGANSIFMGDTLLTAANPSEDRDMQLLARLGMQPMVAWEHAPEAPAEDAPAAPRPRSRKDMPVPILR